MIAILSSFVPIEEKGPKASQRQDVVCSCANNILTLGSIRTFFAVPGMAHKALTLAGSCVRGGADNILTLVNVRSFIEAVPGNQEESQKTGKYIGV